MGDVTEAEARMMDNRRERGVIAPCSWTPEESEVESYEHQDNANIHRQPFPESVSEEPEIYTDYDGYHRRHVKHDSYLSTHQLTSSCAACRVASVRALISYVSP
jgi:hypothetical protein